MANGVLVNSGLDRIILRKETTMGTPPITFTHDGITKGIGVEQTRENPYRWLDTYNQEQIETSRGSHIQRNNTIMNGRRDVTLDVTSAISKNDFIAPASKVFQVYTYNGLLFDTTVTDVTNGASYSVLTVVSADNITEGKEVNLGTRVLPAEDGIYRVIKVDGTSVTIDALLDDTDDTGAFQSTVGIHSLKVQKDDCDKQINSSYTMWLPNRFPNETNTCENGELVTGMAASALNLSLMASTYQLTARAKDYTREYDNQPLYTTDNNSDYLEPDTENDGFSSQNNALLFFKNSLGEWVELDTTVLDCNIVLNLNEDQGAFRANKFSTVIVDGVNCGGTYEAFVKDRDDANNISNQIIEKRNSETNEIDGRVQLMNEDGTGFYIEGNISFMNPTTPDKAVGGFSFTSDYMFTASETYDNIEMVIYNNYTQDLTNYI